MSSTNNKNDDGFLGWLRRYSDRVIDGILSSVLSTIIITLGVFVINQWPMLMIPAIVLGVLLVYATWRYLHRLIPQRSVVRPIVGHPISNPESFYGRYDQTRQFFEYVTGPQLSSISILGTLRSGKTSFLRFVTHPTVQVRHLDRAKYLFVFLNLEGGKIHDPDSFYTEAIKGIYSELNHFPKTISVPVRSGYNEEDFENLVRAPGRDGIRLVILLDEFERLVDRNQFDGDFFSHLRSLVVECNLGWVTTSFRPLHRVLAGIQISGSPFYNIFRPPLYLGALEVDSRNNLVREPFQDLGMSITDEEISFINKLAGSLPSWLQLATDAYFDHRKDWHHRDQRSLEETVSFQFDSVMADQFEQYWKQFDDEEQNVLSDLVGKSRAHGSRHAPLIENRHLLNDLERYGIVGQVEGEFKISSSAFVRWIEKQEHSGRSSARH